MMRTTSGRTTPRGTCRARRPRNKRKPNYLLLFSVFTVSGIMAGTIAFALNSPHFVVREVKIDGVKLADRHAVKSAAGIALGKNILLLRHTPIIVQIKRLPEVAVVKTGRRFPNKIWIRVWERKPFATVASANGFFLIQDDGTPFHRVSSPKDGLPLISVQDERVTTLGRRHQCVGLDCAIKALKCAREEGLKVAKISVDPCGDMCLNMGNGFYVKLGQPDDIEGKMSTLRRALVYRPSIARDALYIDLSCPSAPVWKPKVVSQVAS